MCERGCECVWESTWRRESVSERVYVNVQFWEREREVLEFVKEIIEIIFGEFRIFNFFSSRRIWFFKIPLVGRRTQPRSYWGTGWVWFFSGNTTHKIELSWDSIFPQSPDELVPTEGWRRSNECSNKGGIPEMPETSSRSRRWRGNPRSNCYNFIPRIFNLSRGVDVKNKFVCDNVISFSYRSLQPSCLILKLS